MDAQPLPTACTLDAAGGAERRERWGALSRRALSDRTPTPDGVRLLFRRDEGVEAELRELAELERDCCGFATWSVTTGADALVLDVSADDAGADAVRAMFS